MAGMYSVSVADIETWNIGSWGWKGCSEIKLGDFVCVSSGALPMPKALPDAVCGPQTPGATRPANYADLASVKPCLPSNCCSRWFQCGNATDFCSTDNGCLSGCGAHALQIVADVLKNEAKKQAPTTTAAATTSTKSKEKTTSKSTTSTTTTKKKVAVSTNAPEVESEWPWVITLYEDEKCTGNYFALQGDNTDKSNMECLNLQAWISTDIETGPGKNSCRWWTEGGLKWDKCTKSKMTMPKSWFLQKGACEMYRDQTCGEWAGGQSLRGCHGPREKYWSPDAFTSFRCYNNSIPIPGVAQIPGKSG
ncbi:unnamed protein product [Penicillium bialowiezense]